MQTYDLFGLTHRFIFTFYGNIYALNALYIYKIYKKRIFCYHKCMAKDAYLLNSNKTKRIDHLDIQITIQFLINRIQSN